MRNCPAKRLLASYDRKRRGVPARLADCGASPVACRNVGRDFWGVNAKLWDVVRPSGFEQPTLCSGGSHSHYESVTYILHNPILSLAFSAIWHHSLHFGGYLVG